MNQLRGGRRERQRSSSRTPLLLQGLESRLLLSTVTVTGGTDANANGVLLENAIVNAQAGDTILVTPGTYNGQPTTADPSTSHFWINKALTIKSTGGAGVTTLSVPSGQVQNVLISSSNVDIDGFTLSGGQFGLLADNFQNNHAQLSNIVVRNLVVNPEQAVGDGIAFTNINSSVIDSCVVNMAYTNGIALEAGSSYDIVMNSTVNGTVTQHALAIANSNHNQMLNNTVTQSAFDGIIVVTSSYNRVEGNTIAGHKYDGISVTDNSDYNSILNNAITSTGYADGITAGTGIWLNSESDGNFVFGNSMSGSPENGIDVFVSSNNVIEANNVFNNHQGGIFIYDALEYPASVGNVPTNNVVTGNYIHGNPMNGGVNVKGGVDTLVTNNFVQGTSTGQGTSSDGGFIAERSTNTTVLNNTFENLATGVYIYANSTGTTFYHNRVINALVNYAFPSASVAFDGGATLGGNYWSDETGVAGNPSAGTPYTKFVYDSVGHLGGPYADNFPFQSETLGNAVSVTVTSPFAGTTVANGSIRTISWQAPASTLVDLVYSSSETGDVTIISNLPNSGFYRWNVPTLPAGTDYTIKVIPKDSSGNVQGAAGLSDTFAAAGGSDVTLLTPGADLQAAAGGTLRVAWKDAAAGTPVSILLQVDGGAWQTLASHVTSNFADVTLPNVNTTNARIEVLDETSGQNDAQDGHFTISQSGIVTSTLPAAVAIGSTQQLSWTSPANAVTADVAYWNGSSFTTIANRVPIAADGHFEWIVPGTVVSNSQIQVTYHDAGDAAIGTATSGNFNITGPTLTPAQLVFTRSPSSGAPGALGTVQVAVEDASGRIVTGDTSTVTLSILTGPSSTFSGTATATVVNGIATFSDLSIPVGGTYTLQAIDGSLVAGVSAPFTLQSTVPVKLAYHVLPGNAAAGLLPAVVVYVEDKHGNLVTDDASTITLTLTGTAGGTLGGTTSVQASGGVATFSNLTLTKSGAYTLVATDGALKAAKSRKFTIAADITTEHLVLLQAPPATVAIGNSLPAFSVERVDQYGNVVTTPGTATVTLAANSSGATVTGTVAAHYARGIAAFKKVTITAASGGTPFTLQINDPVLAATAGDTAYAPISLSESVTQGTATILPPHVAPAYAFGKNANLTVLLRSTAGKKVPFTGTVTIVDTANNNALLGTGVLNPKGIVKFSLAGITPGTYAAAIVYSGDVNQSAATSAPFTLTFNKAATNTLLKPAAATVTAGTDVTLTATVAAKGAAATATGTITFMEAGVTLGTVTLTGGVATFTITAPAAGAHAYTAVYSGDTDLAVSTSKLVKVTVK